MAGCNTEPFAVSGPGKPTGNPVLESSREGTCLAWWLIFIRVSIIAGEKIKVEAI
jgi:hypothetical protein